MQIRCVVAATYSGVPDFFGCTVKCSQDDYDNGRHYELAEDAAVDDGASGVMVSFDENDGPAWLFENVKDALDELVTADGLVEADADDDD